VIMIDFDMENLSDLHIPPNANRWFYNAICVCACVRACTRARTKVSSKPRMQVCKSWCLLSSSWVGLDSAGKRQQFFKKVYF
jgi:hypothetical protein